MSIPEETGDDGAQDCEEHLTFTHDRAVSCWDAMGEEV